MEFSGLGLRVRRAPCPGTQSRGTRSGSKQGTVFAQICGPFIHTSHKTPPFPLLQLFPAFGAGGSTGRHTGDKHKGPGNGKHISEEERKISGQTTNNSLMVSVSSLKPSKTLQGLFVVVFSSLSKKIAWFSKHKHVKWKEVLAFELFV